MYKWKNRAKTSTRCHTGRAGGKPQRNRGFLVGRRSRMPQESEIERYEYQDNSYIHDKPLPEMSSEEQDIYDDDDGYHQHKEDRYNVWRIHSNKCRFVSEQPLSYSTTILATLF